MNIVIKQIYADDSVQLEAARTLFMNYFMDLYQHKTPQQIGLTSETQKYLTSIFDKTVEALHENDKLYAFSAFLNNDMVGFTTFGVLEDDTTVLVRTLPINLAYKDQELAIRKALVQHVTIKIPQARRIVIMVRKANEWHQNLCLQAGFKRCDEIFEQSEYVKNTYRADLYYGYYFLL